MNPLDPENELIDKYLQGNLHGRELESFLKNLENDPILKKEVEFQLLLVNGIKDKGALELKNFIRSRTTQSRVMKVSFKAWYYAAAALAVILLAAVALLMNNQNNAIGSGETDIAANKNSNLPPQDRIAEAPSDVPTFREKKEQPGSTMLDETVLDNSGDDKDGVAENESEPTIYPESIVIASNIPVIPIKIQSELDEVNVMERASVPVKVSGNKGDVRKPTGKADSDGVAESSSNSVDSAFARQKSQIAAIQNATTNFKLSFINTKDALPQISIKQNAQNGVSAADVVVYNLPYDNPLIFNLDSRYFLKTGEKYYEINMGKTGKQTVTPVTDTTVLAALEN